MIENSLKVNDLILVRLSHFNCKILVRQDRNKIKTNLIFVRLICSLFGCLPLWARNPKENNKHQQPKIGNPRLWTEIADWKFNEFGVSLYQTSLYPFQKFFPNTKNNDVKLFKGLKLYYLSVSIGFHIFSQFKIDLKKVSYSELQLRVRGHELRVEPRPNTQLLIFKFLESDWTQKNLFDQSAEYETFLN